MLVIVTVAVDQATKGIARLYLNHPGDVLGPTYLEGWVRFFYLRNPGSIFGLFANYQPIIMALTLLILLVLLVMIARERFAEQRLLLALIIGGGAGNFIDRLYEGAVFDFIQLQFLGTPGLVLNIADFALFAGGIVLLVRTFYKRCKIDKLLSPCMLERP